MGYTHYFEHEKVSKELWAKIVTGCFKAHQHINIPIIDDRDDSSPKFTNEHIWFNGVGDDSYETFVLEKEGSNGFAFCKTAYKPYDLLVCACLLIYKHYSPNTIKLGSDGFNKDGTEEVNWTRARELINNK